MKNLSDASSSSRNDEWLTLDAAASQLGVTRKALYAWLQRGHVAHHRFGRLIRIHTADLQAFIERTHCDGRWQPYGCLPAA